MGHGGGIAGRTSSCLKKERRRDWVVYDKRPFAGPEQVLADLARYTHRIAISNTSITAFDGSRAIFRVEDYRKHGNARSRQYQPTSNACPSQRNK